MNTSTDAAAWQHTKRLLDAALALAPSERPAFVQRHTADNPTLRDDLLSLLAAAQDDNDLLDTPPAALLLDAMAARTEQAWVGQRLGPYAITALIARGGMGEVYRAERVDGQFHQQVAIKLLRSGFETAAAVARFKTERQILASLDHPNLAKVLDGGMSPDGLPYFVMELVAGEPIDAYCDRLHLRIPQRLQLFRTVCQVVHYAHQKGVVHRDLKVDNLLVTHDGTVKLVDFGIAKRLQPLPDDTSVGDTTATVQRALTPSYASPEQLRGEAVTPASDIYSLGVVLYRLLVHVSPYGAAADNPYTLARAICEDEPTLPSDALSPQGPQARSLRRRLKGDLDAVVMMALRKEPSRRYASAEAMADDVFRHLEGLPVQARRGAWSYRAGRFLLRNRVVVGATLLANVALVVALALVSHQTWVAKRERTRAERHFDGVRQLAHMFIFELDTAIGPLPGSTPARKLVVEKALGYLEQLSAEPDGDDSLQVELAAGYRKVGDIQGWPYSANLADPKGAMVSYDKGAALLRTLLASPRSRDLKPDDRRAAEYELALIDMRRGTVHTLFSQLKEADAAFALAESAAAALVGVAPDEVKHQLLLGQVHAERARTTFYADDHVRYLKIAALAQERLQKVVMQRPDDRDAGLSLARLHATRGEYFMAQKEASPEQAREALLNFQAGLALVSRFLEREPDNATLARMTAIAHNRIAWTYLRLGEAAQAAREYRMSLDLATALSSRAPRETQFRSDRARSGSDLARALLLAGDANGAALAARDAVAIFESLPEGARAENSTRYRHGVGYWWLGQALEARARQDLPNGAQRKADLAEACRSYRLGLPILQEIHERFGLGSHPDDLHPDKLREALTRCPAAG
jgi:eukaryotic-like serine/threonine-protein kinase